MHPARFPVRLWLVRAVALVGGTLLGVVFTTWIQRPRAASPTSAATAIADSRHISLGVKRDGRVLQLEWDPKAPPILTADHATLHITDGNHQTNLNLSTSELSVGAISYWAETPEVAFRLEVFGGGRKTDDSVRAAAELGSQTPPSPAVEPVQAVVAAPKQARRNRPSAQAEVGPPPIPLTPRPSPFEPPPKPASAPLEAISNPPAPPTAAPAMPVPVRSPEPRIEVSSEPAPASRLSRAVGHIPLIRRLKKDQQIVVPAEPVRQPKPTLSAADRHALIAEVPIDVRVYVAESGKVDYAELLNARSASRHPALAEAAVFAARRWDFHPARQGEQPVSSEVILHFRFKPAED
jgi:TonB family protein